MELLHSHHKQAVNDIKIKMTHMAFYDMDFNYNLASVL